MAQLWTALTEPDEVKAALEARARERRRQSGGKPTTRRI